MSVGREAPKSTALLLVVVAVGLLCSAPALWATEAAGAAATTANETCLVCHNPEGAPHVQSIFDSSHAELDCVSCHGAPGNHTRSPSRELPAVTFGPKHFASVGAQNTACLGCHGDTLEHWRDGPHFAAELTCSSCHQSHAAEQLVLQPANQSQTCLYCHDGPHPIALDTSSGPAVCSTCHTPHGADNPAQLAFAGADPESPSSASNDTCLLCHNPASSPHLQGIFDSTHADLDCVSCHGAPGNHTRSPSRELPAVSFGPIHFASVEAQSAACLSCHDDAREHWREGPHFAAELTCNSCHQSHAAEQLVLQPESQSQTCLGCHKAAHPTQLDATTGPVVCTNCHSPHGADNPAQLALTDAGLESDQLCLSCHTPDNSPAVHGIFGTAHGISDDPRTPTAGDGCRACHGDPGNHPLNPTVEMPEISFGPNHFASVESQNSVCLDCHSGDLMHWDGGTHSVEDIVCSDCHDTHTPRQPVLQRLSQADTCYGCHQDVRAQARLPSRHPLLEAQLVCTDCHTPHGSVKPGELVGLNLSDTCLGCHEDQRGPFLFEHPPVSEDCSNCHVPHGAVHEPLLTARTPFLCQDCHIANFHPSDLNSGAGLPAGQANAALLGRNCMNCHPKVHGSNHPSGARLTR